MPEHEILPPFPGSAVPHVGTYRRVLPVNLERMYENALDWEHLPFVHGSNFSGIACIEAGSWGWRAEVTSPNGGASIIELRLDRVCRRWITRNLSGPNAGAEIWTHVFSKPDDGHERLEIVVDFFVPGIEAAAREKVGRSYAKLYASLYDEDVAMMVARQEQLDRRVEGARPDERRCVLGRRSDLKLPQICTVGGCDYVIVEVAGELVVFPTRCPHRLGPLAAGDLEDGVVACPWHGYRFDVRTGECVSGQSCRLSNVPVLSEDNGAWVLSAQH